MQCYSKGHEPPMCTNLERCCLYTALKGVVFDGVVKTSRPLCTPPSVTCVCSPMCLWGFGHLTSLKQCDIRSFFVSSERSLPDLNDTLWCALVVIHNFELDFTSKTLKSCICYFLFYIVISFWFSTYLLIISHYAQIFKMSHYQICHTLFISHLMVKRMVWYYQG